MNKNLKKVISAVAALAMSASTFVAFAANYPDVDASASYKQAVDELSALKVLEGYEDGTFQPDKLVNRAEFAKMVITVLGKAELAQAEAAANANTAFPDVKGDHWAAGYVTAATANKIINGFDDGTFKPDANITYAQAMKMLVCAAGYEQWSTDKGGWPTGYMYYGNQLGVGNGVKDVVQDTEITRAQCAQMIDNVLNAPVCVETGEMSYDIYGNQYPKLVQKDGTGVGFQSILTKKHDAYKVKGMVTGTHKSGDSDIDEVTFKIMTAKNWNDEDDQIKKSDDYDAIKALIGASEADKYLHQYVEALIAVNDDDEFEILSVALAGKNDEYKFDAADYDSDEEFDPERIYISKDGKTSNKKIDSAAKLFVNGVEVGDYSDEDKVNKYIANNNVGTVTLIDTPGDSNSTDGKFDYVMVDVYKTAVVDSVNVIDDETIDIYIADGDTEVMNLGTWSIDLSAEDTVYSFTCDGAAYDIADLEMYDVLTIQYNVESGMSSSNFFDVMVSKASNAIEGSIKTVNVPDDDESELDYTYDVDGTTYKIATESNTSLKAGDSYTFYLDVFGRIAYTDEIASDKKIAILDAAYTNAAGKGKADLILADGSVLSELTLRDTAVSSDANVPKDVKVDGNIEWAKYVVYGNVNGGSDKKPVKDRVVEYSINANNELLVKSVLTPYTKGSVEYKASNSKLGSYSIDADTTALINAKDETDIKAMSISTLINGNMYEAYCYDRSNATSVYRFVIITTGAGDYTPSTRVAVVKKVQNTTNADGDAIAALSVVIGGDEDAVVNVDDTAKGAATALKEGDIIVYETDASGNITKIDHVLNTSLSSQSSYVDVYDAVIGGKDLIVNGVAGQLEANGSDDVEFRFGPIIDSTNTSVTLGEIKNGQTDKSELEDLAFASDVAVTAINYGYKSGTAQRITAADRNAVLAINFPKASFADADTDRNIISWADVPSTTNPRFALVKIVGDEVTDVVVLIPKSGLDRD